MTKSSTIQQKTVDTTKNISSNARHLAQKVSKQAKEEGQEKYAQAQSGLGKLTVAATAGLALVQGILRYNEGRTRKSLYQATRKVRDLQDTLQPASEKTQAILQDSLTTTRQSLKKGLETTQDTLQQRSKDAQKKLKRVQKSAQGQFASSLSATQDVLEEGSKRIRKNLERVDLYREDVQKARQKRARRRQFQWRLFRWGLVAGFVLALLYTPISGEEVRNRLVGFWNNFK